MWKRMSLTALLMLSYTGICAAEKTPVLKINTIDKIVTAPSPVKIKVESGIPATHQARAWRVIAYLPNVPPDFPKQTGFKVNPHKMKEWSTVQIMNWNWNIPASGILELSTMNWPEGDYGLLLYLLCRPKEKTEKLPDLYLNQTFIITVQKK